MKKLRIVVDNKVAFPEAFERFGTVNAIDASQINNKTLKDCDILIIRTITKVDENLLLNTPVKFVGSATSGLDHIDINYLNNNNIFLADAKGCNSYAVAEYIITSIMKIFSSLDKNFSELSIGVIGCGNIGSKVALMSSALGMKVLINDPPLKETLTDFNSLPLEEILKCNIISVNVPLTFDGEYKTYKMLSNNLKLINDNSILINTARGEVIDENWLLNVAKDKNIKLVLDVWQNEPQINLELLKESIIATPHIAGYSLEGKINATKILFEKLNNYLNLNFKFDFGIDLLNDECQIEFFNELNPKNFYSLLKKVYNIDLDSFETKKILSMNKKDGGKFFNHLRNSYKLRRSFKDFILLLKDDSSKVILEQLRFQTKLI